MLLAQWEGQTPVTLQTGVRAPASFQGFVPIRYIFDSKVQRTKSRPDQAFSFCMLVETKNYIHTYTYSYNSYKQYTNIFRHILTYTCKIQSYTYICPYVNVCECILILHVCACIVCVCIYMCVSAKSDFSDTYSYIQYIHILTYAHGG